MNIKKQLQNLYLYEIISGLQIVDAVWVLLLLSRGFSLAQTGIAEGFFHVVSMCCEIPSGMLSDMIGRKKTLILAGLVSAAGSFVHDCHRLVWRDFSCHGSECSSAIIWYPVQGKR